MKRDYTLFIRDIVESIRHIGIFIEDMSYKQFSTDEKTVSAVIRKLEIIGEAAKHVPPSIKKRHQDLPWNEMARMRDKLIHGYFGVDLEIIWKVVRERLPDILPALEEVLQEMMNKKGAI